MNSYLRIAVAASISLVSACSSMPDSRTAQTEVGKYSYLVAGQGAPSIVFESGLGTFKETWHWIFSDLARTTRVFAYDRAGTGESVARSNNRSGAQIVSELHDLLAEVNIGPPYVLVGHSMGGMYISLFARTYPDEIAAVVYVDARHEEFAPRCWSAHGKYCAPTPTAAELMGEGKRASAKEIAGEALARQQLREAGPFPPVPVLVLTAVETMREAKSNEVWMEMQQELAKLSPKGKQVICKDCGHTVFADDPGLVAGEIRKIVEQTRLAH
jgi:pimeloyl-ACP methyl ester carboxylesterase